MNVLVDTCVWSLAFRRHAVAAHEPVRELGELIAEGRAQMIGPVRQELLSGVPKLEQFRLLRDRLRAFPDLPIETEDHELAAEHFTRTRAAGIQGSNTDLLICALSSRRALPILTTDRDFERFARVLPIFLHMPRTATGVP
jgi:predicted nucleic acid-binding protein